MAVLSFRTITNGVLLALFSLMFLFTGALAAQPPQVTVLATISQGLSTPVNIASDQFGSLYVTDPRAGGVVRLSSSGRFQELIPTAKEPLGIVVRADGSLVVSMGDHVSILDKRGVELRRLGAGAGQFRMASGIALDATGFIYVVDSLNDCVQVFNASGDPVTIGAAAPGKPANSFGTGGIATGQFATPTGITFEKNANQLAVVDTGNGRIEFFSLTGSIQKSIGSAGSGPLKFAAPRAVDFEYSRDPVPVVTRMYVTDSYESNIQVLDATGNGTFLSFIGNYGTTAGELLNPSDALFDQVNSRLLVVNGFGNLTLYGINGGTSPSVDTIPPILTLNPVPQFTNVNSVTISGTVDAGSRVTVNGVQAGVNGTLWNLVLAGLLPGTNPVAVAAYDRSGNQATLSTSINYDPTSTQFTVNRVVTPTNMLSQVLTGTVEAGGSVTVTNNTTAAIADALVTGTSWSCTVLLVDGANNLTITADNAPKNPSSSSVTITVVRTSPVLSVSTLANGSVSRLSLLNVSGTAVVDATFDKLTVNGLVVPVQNGFFSSLVPLQPGSNTITVTASDLAGNTSTDSRTIIFDSVRPKVAITAPADGTITSVTQVTVTGTADPGYSVTVKVNGTVISSVSATSWSLPVFLDAGIGINTIEAVATDQNGKSSSAKSTVIVNTVRPGLSVTSPSRDGFSNRQDQVISGTVAASTGIALTATVNGITASLTLDNQTFTLNPEFTLDGTYVVAITAVDVAGNASTTFRTVELKTAPPLLTIATPVSSIPPTRLTGTIERGATITITDHNGPVGLVTIANGQWSADFPGGYDPALVNLYATDEAGNSSRSGALKTITGQPGIGDALQALWFALGIYTPTYTDLLHGDVAPLQNGVPAPNGKIDVGDVVVILRKVVGLIFF